MPEKVPSYPVDLDRCVNSGQQNSNHCDGKQIIGWITSLADCSADMKVNNRLICVRYIVVVIEREGEGTMA